MHNTEWGEKQAHVGAPSAIFFLSFLEDVDEPGISAKISTEAAKWRRQEVEETMNNTSDRAQAIKLIRLGF